MDELANAVDRTMNSVIEARLQVREHFAAARRSGNRTAGIAGRASGVKRAVRHVRGDNRAARRYGNFDRSRSRS